MPVGTYRGQDRDSGSKMQARAQIRLMRSSPGALLGSTKPRDIIQWLALAATSDKRQCHRDQTSRRKGEAHRTFCPKVEHYLNELFKSLPQSRIFFCILK